MKIGPRGCIGAPDKSNRANKRRTNRDRDATKRSRSGVKRIAQFQRNVPTRPRSRSIAICWGKDGTRYVTVISGARGTRREKERKSERERDERRKWTWRTREGLERMCKDRISDDRFRSAKTGCIAHRSRNSFDRAEMARRALMAREK